ASIANSVLGFGFWALAAHLFSSGAVGIAGALVSLSSLATSIGILGLDNGLVRFATRVDRPRALMWELLLIGGTLSAIVGLALSATVLTLSAKDLRVTLTEQQFVVLVLLTVVLTGSQTSFQITDGSILAARRSQYLALILNDLPASVSKSLYAHGSLHDRLPAALTSSMRRLLLAILVPMVALGVLLAQIGMTIVGGTTYGNHGLALQLFLLATLPK